MTDRRSFITASAAALGALPVLRLPVNQGADPLKNLIVVNALGGLDEGYAPPPPGPPVLITQRAIAAGKASGMTALNTTLAGGNDFETTVEAIATYDAFIRANSDTLLKVYTTADIRHAKAQNKVGIC